MDINMNIDLTKNKTEIMVEWITNERERERSRG